jgi:thioredoxin 1|tara:strand:+ start:2320 stop:2637 length:318 start_codon:yes stop_codon:yes gene_type:complete
MVITSQELREKMESGEKFIVDMYAEWCGPCRVLGPIVERYAQKLKEEGSEIGVYKFDIETDKELAMELGVRSIPTIKAISNGEIITTKTGILNESQLDALTETLL